jgi:hypothetical protein
MTCNVFVYVLIVYFCDLWRAMIVEPCCMHGGAFMFVLQQALLLHKHMLQYFKCLFYI